MSKTREEMLAAYNAIREGRTADALLILERNINPKWGSRQSCTEDYADARKGGK
jgi:hypothetical protein